MAGEIDAEGEYRQRLVALDATGHLKPGWPIEEPPASEVWSLAVGADDSVYIEECEGSGDGCALHRLGDDGRALPGWPFEVPASSACLAGGPCASFRRASLVVGSDGTAYLASGYQTGDQTEIIAIDAAGTIVPGWPVALEHRNWSASGPQLSSDGTVFILSRFESSERPASRSLAAFAPDGSLRPGWPVSVPDMVGYFLGPKGTVVVRSLIDYVEEGCPHPRRTVFTVLRADGRTLPGWPQATTGYATGPVVGADGTVYYVSALGSLHAHNGAGEIKSGWPVAVPGATNSPGCGPPRPYLAPDGTIYVLGDEVTARSPDGGSRPGWPYRPTGLLYLYTDDSLEALRPDPAFGPDGTVYLVVFGRNDAQDVTEIVALDPNGQLKPGWPYRLATNVPTYGDLSLAVSPDGRLYVYAGVNFRAPGPVLLALNPDGRISD